MGSHDLTLTRRDDARTTFGYVLDWNDEVPMRVTSQPPELPVSTSTNVSESGGNYSGRDAAPPYPIEVNNWQDGAGQPTYDTAKSSPDAFDASHNIDVSDQGHFELGPRAFSYSYNGAPDVIGDRAIHALGTFYASFVPGASDPRDSIRLLARVPVISHSGAGWLASTTSTSLVVTDASALSDISEGLSVWDVQPWQFLYCPTHNEMVAVSAVTGDVLTVSRGACGTTAAEHTAGETWYGFHWVRCSFTGPVQPTAPVTSFCSDGASVYASFYSGSGASGEVWSGAAGMFTKFGDIQQVVDMAYCAGYLYCAQDNVGGKSQVTAVESNGTTTHVITGAGGISPNTTTAGLVTMGNYVYWLVTDGHSQSWVYRLQYGTTPVFELAAVMPSGFVGTAIVTNSSQLYVGGYIDSLTTDPDNAGDERYWGYLYAITSASVDYNSEVAVACKWTDPEYDYRIKGLVVGGPYIYMLTPRDVRAYSIEHGGWWHVADVQSSSATVSTDVPVPGVIDWTAKGFSYLPSVTGKKPNEASAIRTESATWEDGSSGFVTAASVVADYSAGHGLTSSAAVGADYYMTVNAGKYYRWTLDGLPSGSFGTLVASVRDVESQGGALCISSQFWEAQAQLQGATIGGVRKMRVGLRYCASGGASYVGKRWSDYMPADSLATIWLQFDPAGGARLYVNGALAVTVATTELKTVTGTDATKVWFSCGWPGDPQGDTNPEQVFWNGVWFVADSYTPDYQTLVSHTVGMDTSSIAFGEGRLLIPAPALCATYIDPKENAGQGWLRTSESGLHMGTVGKYFTSVDVIHSPLKDGQSITITPYVDGVATGSTVISGQSSDVGSTVSTATVQASGKRFSVQVGLTDTTSYRRSADHLRVSSITGRFFPENGTRLHTFVVNCRPGAQTRSGTTWEYDADEAIRNAFAIADSGEVVDVNCLWGDFSGRLEELDLLGAPADRTRYDALSGTMRLKIRSLE